jgi:bifunctional non-homologous end joining protein LigD
MTRATSPAARTEDYPLEYLEFEGTIPEGSYRADEVRVWSAGRRVRRVRRAQGPRRAARAANGGRYALYQARDDWRIHARTVAAGDCASAALGHRGSNQPTVVRA